MGHKRGREQLAKLRQRKRISLRLVAEELGVSHTTLFRWEEGLVAKLPPYKMVAWTQALDACIRKGEQKEQMS